jgi:hypothetical protein
MVNVLETILRPPASDIGSRTALDMTGKLMTIEESEDRHSEFCESHETAN